MSGEPLFILLAEDDDGQALLVERNLTRAGIAKQFLRVADGEEALRFVYREGKFADRPTNLRLVLLLDMNMPKVDGLEVLSELKGHAGTAQIPIVMLTTTDNPREIERCFAKGCNLYITKPVAYEAFVDAIARLSSLLEVVKVPQELAAARRPSDMIGAGEVARAY